MQSSKKRVAIVGAGPAGLSAGVAALVSGFVQLDVYDTNPEPGVKLLVSGSGQCNIMSGGSLAERLTHYPEHARKFLQCVFKARTPQDILAWFEERGIAFELRHDGLIRPLVGSQVVQARGKIFPAKGGALGIRDALANAIRSGDGRLRGQETVHKIEKSINGFTLYSASAETPKEYDSVILSTGGISWPKTGSSGAGYRFAQDLGHTLVRPVPALTSLVCREYEAGQLAGLALRDVQVRIVRNGLVQATTKTGDVLWTHKGVSGPAILDLAYAIRQGDEVSLACISEAQASKYYDRAISLASQEGATRISRIIECTGVPRTLQDHFLAKAGIDRADRLAILGKKKLQGLFALLRDFRISVTGIMGIDQAMCTAGGVSLNQIESRTMESKLVRGLFFCGEVLDINGDCGGYNIQAAMATGWVAGTYAAAN
jgi:predicted Rossmann fold flavoprotein